ncbi:hypothetical protein KSP40_PGU009560 [Platanthera guangdongensis]|uniref:Ankyrin repeat domain-containing protein n=1 Tax=Platanthera guangdongensis TaxID=2320717 RepID=A0ABR2LN94_9ASPA
MRSSQSPMAEIDASKYAHSPVHKAVLKRDHDALRRILSSIPRISPPARTLTEAEAIAEEGKADVISAIIDRRDVPKRETPLHLAVKLADVVAVGMLMSSGADSSLQNKQGWSPLQEAICAREELIAKIILRHHPPLAWAKWCRRMPRIVAAMTRMRDFYMEITYHFESSVIPFISRIVPSYTYKIWKKGANLRADMTFSGFDAFKIKRSDQSVLFLGEGSVDGKVIPGSLFIISHEDKEVLNALDGAGSVLSDEELKQEVEAQSRAGIVRPGLDVTRAVLLPEMNWRKQHRSEMVGPWKANVYNMHNVVFSMKSRNVPAAMDDDGDEDEYGHAPSEEERSLLEASILYEQTSADAMPSTSHGESGDIHTERTEGHENWMKGKDHKHDVGTENRRKDSGKDSEYKKSLRPALWLSPNFPLKTEELLPLMDILANKIKAIRRFRELITTKLPAGTFPVKVAIPVIPTFRMLITFTKFEGLQCSLDEELSNPPLTPERQSPQRDSSISWAQRMIDSYRAAPNALRPKSSPERRSRSMDLDDPFLIPSDYAWTTSEEKKEKKKMLEASGKLKKRQGKKETNAYVFCTLVGGIGIAGTDVFCTQLNYGILFQGWERIRRLRCLLITPCIMLAICGLLGVCLGA